MTLVLIWAALVLLLILEVVSALLHAGWVAFGLAPIMVLLVAGGFMHVLKGSQLTRIFAATGVFWLLILVGLGGIDFFARHDYPAPVLSREQRERAELQRVRRARVQPARVTLHVSPALIAVLLCIRACMRTTKGRLPGGSRPLLVALGWSAPRGAWAA